MRKFLVLVACMILLSGCTQSNIVKPTAETKVADPDFSLKDDIDIDWEQVSLDAEDVFENKSEFPYSDNFHFLLEPEKKEIMLVWVVSDDFPTSEIRNYADTLIKGFNDVVAVQDFSISKSSDTSFGGIWKNYALSFGIAPVSTQDDEETWFISGNYGAGVDFVLPDIEQVMKQVEEEERNSANEETTAPAETTAAESGEETQAPEAQAETE